MVWPIGNCKMHSVRYLHPSTISAILTFRPRALVNRHSANNLAAYITSDCSDVYEDAFFETATTKTGHFQQTIILISTRLGLDRVTPVYWEALKAALQMPQSIGIAGCVCPRRNL